ncbi:DUF2063 domain-containing protein [Methylophaga sp. SB9B]|uniref:HvfC family RiPP maturation protein n=1 Tax=Methylophaga sp. SB9B TaxID=2570356 RepID=UPI0010A8EDD7|nr:PqqD family peptide modification chaperone [Methylophaga sp. SB9B]THK41842.1 DUF2063 domain-containing protein [Methylophaga sp. SB9B]
MSQAPDFKQTQQQFTAHLRDPQGVPEPADVESRRMAIYQRLIYNNIESFLSSACPVLKQILGEKPWHNLAADFIRQHRCSSPLFNDIAREFVSYLEQHPQQYTSMPFIAELAHYEWVELALSIASPDFQKREVNKQEDILQLTLQRSPLSWSFAYDYPVHSIAPDNLPDQPAETPFFLLLYRNAEDQVKFIELNPVSARLLDLLDAGQTGQQAAEAIAEALQHPNPDIVTQGARQLIEDWLERGIVI